MRRKYLIYWRLPLTSYVGSKVIAQPVYRVDRSYSWNYGHSPTLPRVRRVPSGPGGKLFDHPLNSPIGIAAGPLLNSKWIEAYSRVGFDVLTYKTVRSMAMPAHALPNIRPVENREHAAIATAKRVDGQPTLAVSLGIPSVEPEVWRKDVRRAKDRIGSGRGWSSAWSARGRRELTRSSSCRVSPAPPRGRRGGECRVRGRRA